MISPFYNIRLGSDNSNTSKNTEKPANVLHNVIENHKKMSELFPKTWENSQKTWEIF